MTSSSIGAERRCRPASSTSAASGGGAEPRRRAHRAAPAVPRLRIIELLLQHAHQAPPVGAEALHRSLLLTPQGGDTRVALGVIRPPAVRHEHPARAVAAQRSLDIEDLQHRLQPALADVDHAQQLPGGAPGLPGGAQVLQHRRHPLARRERLLDEEVLDAPVLAAAQQHDVGVLDAAAGAADLLVVGHHRSRRLVVHDERQVRLVVAHAQCAVAQIALTSLASSRSSAATRSVGVLLAAVGQRADAAAR